MFSKKEDNAFEEAIKYLKEHNLNSSDYDLISTQVKNVIEELEMSNEIINVEEIIKEVFDQNNLNFIVTEKKKQSITLNKVDKSINLKNEKLDEIELDLKFSNIKINLLNYEFSNNKLLLSISSKTSSIEIYVSKHTFVDEWLNLKTSTVDFLIKDDKNKSIKFNNYNELPRFETKNTLILRGDIKMSAIKVIVID